MEQTVFANDYAYRIKSIDFDQNHQIYCTVTIIKSGHTFRVKAREICFNDEYLAQFPIHEARALVFLVAQEDFRLDQEEIKKFYH